MNKKVRDLIVKVSLSVIGGILISVFIVKPTINKKEEAKVLDNAEIHIRKELKEKELENNIEQEEKVEEKATTIRKESLDNRDKELFYFDKNDVSMTTNMVTEEDLRTMLKGTALEHLADDFLELEKQYGVNAIFVASIASVESGYGSSDIAKKYNNITSIMKGDGTPVYFNNMRECLESTYKLLSRHYIDPNGDWYNGGTDLYSINENYCPDDNYHWANTVSAVMDRLLKKVS